MKASHVDKKALKISKGPSETINRRTGKTADSPNVNFQKYKKTLTTLIKMDYGACIGETIL